MWLVDSQSPLFDHVCVMLALLLLFLLTDSCIYKYITPAFMLKKAVCIKCIKHYSAVLLLHGEINRYISSTKYQKCRHSLLNARCFFDLVYTSDLNDPFTIRSATFNDLVMYNNNLNV